jgi:uncharacterized damage-inducible protein DinB
MFIDAIVRLFEYQRESNEHILEVASRLDSPQLTSEIVEGQPSIRDTFVHMFGAVQAHNSWWIGSMSGEAAFSIEIVPELYRNVSELRNLWSSVDAEVQSFVDPLESDDQLERVYTRDTPQGETRKRVLWEMMLHVINHGTQHRSEVAMMLTKLDHSPGDMEIL